MYQSASCIIAVQRARAPSQLSNSMHSLPARTLQRPRSILPRGEMAESEPSPLAVIWKLTNPLTTARKRPGKRSLNSSPESLSPAKLNGADQSRTRVAHTSVLVCILPLCKFSSGFQHFDLLAFTMSLLAPVSKFPLTPPTTSHSVDAVIRLASLH